MRSRSNVAILITTIVLGSAGLASADVKPGAQTKGRPSISEVQRFINKDLARKQLRADRGALVGPIQFGVCAAAKAAEARYEACEDRCADWAAQQPLTAGDLTDCGDEMSASACAEKIVDSKSRECIRMTGNPGCRDEQVALIKARHACQDCKEEIAKISELNKQKAANDLEISKLLKQLAAARAEAQKLDAELDRLGKPCAPAARPSGPTPAKKH
jgi:hypothetical protein